MSEEQFKQISDRLDRIEKALNEEIESRKKVAKALIKLADKFEEHVQGGMTLEELQGCLQKVNELVSTLQSAGIGIGEGGGQSLLAQVLLAQKLQQQQAGNVEIEKISPDKAKKLKKMLEENEDENEGEDKE